MSQREAEPQSLRLGQRVGEVRWQGEVVLELVDIEADEVSSCRRQLGAGQSQRLGQPGDKGTDEPGRFPSDQAAVERMNKSVTVNVGFAWPRTFRSPGWSKNCRTLLRTGSTC